jgi:hypothetical protein
MVIRSGDQGYRIVWSGIKADSHCIEEGVAWCPVLKKWKEPRIAKIVGPIALEVR